MQEHERRIAQILGGDPHIRSFLEGMGAVYIRSTGTIEYIDPGSDASSLIGLDQISRTYPELSACMRALDGEAQFYRDGPPRLLSEAEMKDRVKLRDLVFPPEADKDGTALEPRPIDYQI